MLRGLSKLPGRKPGLLGMEIIIPKKFVNQEKLESYYDVPAGKYTKGLGQRNMAVCDVDEDIQSMALSATSRLLATYNISHRDVGRLEVGTESPIDKSKSVKTTVMSLFNEQGVHDVEGIDTISACYGGTQALFNTLAWMDSPAYDGRYGIVLAGDIAVYPSGPARPTGGGGMVAMLLGPDAPLTFDPVRYTYMEHAYDFYKPDPTSEYPYVDGHLSNDCYLRALETCVRGFDRNFHRAHGRACDDSHQIFHQPYARLVRKSADLVSSLRCRTAAYPQSSILRSRASSIDSSRHQTPDLSRDDLDSRFQAQTEPSTRIGCELGNLYAGSLYASLLSHLCYSPIDSLVGSRALLFSYGSGLSATAFSSAISDTSGYWIADLRARLDLPTRLAARTEVEPEEYTHIMQRREDAAKCPTYAADPRKLAECGAQDPQRYYLQSVDAATLQRTYGLGAGGASADHGLVT